MYAPGENARLWEEFYRDSIMAFGCDRMGDLRQYPDVDTIAKKLMEVYGLKRHPVNDTRACYDFAYTMKPGDHIIVKRGLMDVVGYGTDKRGAPHSLALAYSKDDEQFSVPPNVFLLGMMNTADRSLALIDYALRRRFCFASLDPLFGTPVLQNYLVRRGAAQAVVAEVSARMAALNEEIAADSNLGNGFSIGHSYFCPAQGALTEEHYFRAVEGKIIPLLKEYWFDNPEKVQHWRDKLTAKFAARAAV